jgi:hypothetical protein
MLLSIFVLAFAQAGEESAPQTHWEFPEQQLHIDLPDTFELVWEKALKNDMTLHQWKTKLGEYSVDFSLVAVPRREWGLQDPFDVAANIAFNRRRSPSSEGFRFEEESALEGPFGTVPIAAFATAGMWNVTERIGTEFFLCGLTAENGYSVRLKCQPAPDKKTRKSIEAFFTNGVSFHGEVEDPQWTEEDAMARWERDRPKGLKGDLKIVRTEHYIIFTNSSSGKLFAKKMEECYDAIQETFPFPEVEGRKLMPVFLFRTKDEYIDYYSAIAKITKKQAANSKGHAWRDYYATYYDSPVDPVHIHEATHQIFSNRLKLSGGGSWFQEGVAEYMSTSKNERKGYARNAARNEGQTPFLEFVVIPSLLNTPSKSETGEKMASNHYKQAASIIDFAMNSKFGKKKFSEFLQAVGSAPRGNVEAIQAALQKVYGVDLAGFEAEWVEHWD